MKDINWMLGGDIIKVIFSKLHICNLPNCRIVCKAWNELVVDYAKFHHHHVPNTLIIGAFDLYSRDIRKISFMHNLDANSPCSVAATLRVGADWQRVSILNSCNGLLHICITYKPTTSLHPQIWAIWNPMSNELFQLPIVSEDASSFNFGFGFNPKTKHYKLFRALQQDSITTIQVLSFNESNHGNTILQWRRAFGYHLPFETNDRGTYLDGVIYFVANYRTKFVICGLDVEIETLDTLFILDSGSFSFQHNPYTRPFHDTVCVILRFHNGKRLVWVMKSKYLWTLQFAIHLPNSLNFSILDSSKDESKLYFTSIFDLCYVDEIGEVDEIEEGDETGKMIKIKRLFPSIQGTFLCSVLHIRSFHFGSLPMILAGNH